MTDKKHETYFRFKLQYVTDTDHCMVRAAGTDRVNVQKSLTKESETSTAAYCLLSAVVREAALMLNFYCRTAESLAKSSRSTSSD